MAIAWERDTQEKHENIQKQLTYLNAEGLKQVFHEQIPPNYSLTEFKIEIEALFKVITILNAFDLTCLNQREINIINQFLEIIKKAVNAASQLTLERAAQLPETKAKVINNFSNAIENIQEVHSIIAFLNVSQPRDVDDVKKFITEGEKNQREYRQSIDTFVRGIQHDIQVSIDKVRTTEASVETKMSTLKFDLEKNINTHINASKSMDEGIQQRILAFEKMQTDHQLKLEVLQEKEESINKLIGQLQSTAQVKETSEHSKLFEGLAKDHLEAAKNWLWVAVILSITMCIFIITLWVTHAIHPWNGDWVVVISGASVAGVIGGLAAWASRNHRRHKHNEIVALHRARTMQSFIHLYNTLDNKDESKGVIVMKSLEAIFAPLPTGYTRDEHGSEDASSTIYEIFRNGKANP